MFAAKTLPVSLSWWWFPILNGTVMGGPFFNAVRSFKGKDVVTCCMAAEIRDQATIRVDTPDFQVPPEDDFRYGLVEIMEALQDGKPVYVGCMGGVGRTGTMLAGIAKVCGVRDPVGYVRKHYDRHAVETQKQKDFIASFDVATIRAYLYVRKFFKTRKFWFGF